MPRGKPHSSFIRSFKYSFIVAGSVLLWDQLRRIRKNIELISLPKVWTKEVHVPQYIYINDPTTEEFLKKFEIGGFTSEVYKIVQLYLLLSSKIKGSKLYEDVFSFHQNLAWRFLRLAQDENYFYRQRAVQALARMPSLSDATCRQLAQASDERSAVGLARCEGVNLRLLLDPPGWLQPLDKRDLLRRLHTFLLKLDAESPHPCLQYVIAQAFAERDHKGFDDDVGFNNSRPEIIPKCAEAILHHSWLGTNTRSIVSHGGLSLLVDLYRVLEEDADNVDSLVMVSRILSNISMHPDFHKQLYMSGCIKVLARLVRHSDLSISVPAARALMNCDTDARPPDLAMERFLRNVYALHPMHRSMANPPEADVVFIHGLLGGVFVTWRERDVEGRPDINVRDNDCDGVVSERFLPNSELQVTDVPTDSNVSPSQLFRNFRRVERRDWEQNRTQCWPRDWLARDCSGIRVLGVNYDTNISMWTPMCPITRSRLTLSDRSTHLIDVLTQAGLGSRPIIWVAHSMGGLIVKDLLVKCSESKDPSLQALVENSKGVVFFSTPHRGSRLATMSPTSRLIVWPTIEVQELRQDSSKLLLLHEKFVRLTTSYPIRILSFAEREPTYVKAFKMDLRFVEDESSQANVGELYGMPLDHLCICKPAKRESFLYQKILHFIEEIIADAKVQKNSKLNSVEM